MFRRWLVAAAALGAGGLVTVALLVYTGSQSATQDEVYVAVRDVPAGAPLAPDTVRLDHVRLGAAGAAAIGPGAARLLLGSRAAHDLIAGQLVQRSDLAAADSGPDRRRVLIPVKDLPPVTAGDRVDLLLVSGGSVAPFVFNLEVVAAGSSGLVVSAPSRAAAALVWAANGGHLVAVVADPGARHGDEQPVGSLEQAEAALGS
jgi:Flp pilus assembly protein CpaB